jgi:hypothetical protein
MPTLKQKMENLRVHREQEAEARKRLDDAIKMRDWWMSQSAIGRKIQKELDAAEAKKDTWKAQVKLNYDEVVAEAGLQCSILMNEGKSPFGRGLHNSINIKRQTAVEILDVVKTAEWLKMCGQEEAVTITLRGRTKFFNNAVPIAGSCNIIKVPKVYVDKDILPGSVDAIPFDADTPFDFHTDGLKKERKNRV